MRISVIVPVYNVSMYLDACIQSVVQQSFQSLQVILVDDGSTDGSAQLCDAWVQKDDRISVIHQENGGLSDARNTGLSHATGDYVYFLDSDDFIELDTLELLFHIAQRLQLQVCCFDGDVFSDDAAAQKDAAKSGYYIKKHVYPQVMTGVEAMELLLKNDEFRPPVQYMFFARNFLLDNDLRFCKGLIHEDELFTMQMLEKAEKVSHVPFLLYHRRIHGASIMAGRKTARNYLGYYASFHWLFQGYTNGSPAFGEALCRANLLRISICMADVYASMQRTQHRMIAVQKREADRAVKENRYFGSLRLRVLWTMQSANGLLKRMKAIYRAGKAALPQSLKRTVKHLLKPAAFRQRKHAIENELDTAATQKVVLICTPEHGNLGDQAIAEVSKQWLSKVCAPMPVKEITINQYEQDARIVEHNIHKGDVVVVCGGGWLGDLWFHNEVAVRRIIQKCKRNRIVILPQTVYFSDEKQKQISKAMYRAHPDLWLCLRDRASYRLITEGGFVQNEGRVFYLPDMVLGFRDQVRNSHRQGVAFCIRSDKESVLDNASGRALYKEAMERTDKVPEFISTLTGTRISKETRRQELHTFFDALAAKRLVVTDRLHCMLFCAVTGTPCIAFDNLSGKVSGSYEWIKDIGYIKLAKTEKEALAWMPQMLKLKDVYTYAYDFSMLFEPVIALIREHSRIEE